MAESKGCRQDILVVVPMMASPGQERRVHSCQFFCEIVDLLYIDSQEGQG